MKKVKYLIVIIVICILVFIGIEVFRKEDKEKIENNINQNEVENETEVTKEPIQEENITIETNGTIEENTTIEKDKTPIENNTQKIEEIKNGQELLAKADKILTARGWAGASNNVIGIKEGIIYYYNKGTEEFRKIATGIEEIYYKTEFSEEITAKKGNNAKEVSEIPTFLIFE